MTISSPLTCTTSTPLRPIPGRQLQGPSLLGDAAGSASGRARGVGRAPDFQPDQRDGPAPRELGQGDGAQALGRFGSPDACPRSESLAGSQKTLGLPQIQLGLPGTIWERTYHSRTLGASAASCFTSPHPSAPPAAVNPPLTTLLTPRQALWAWGVLAGYLSGYPPRRISRTHLGLPLDKLQSFPPSLWPPA